MTRGVVLGSVTWRMYSLLSGSGSIFVLHREKHLISSNSKSLSERECLGLNFSDNYVSFFNLASFNL